jgi:hypothetical protein
MAQASLAVYPEAVQSSVGLPGSLDSGILVETMGFDYGGEEQEYTDENNEPDVLIYSNFKVVVDVKAVLKNRNSPYGQYASCCAKLPIASLPFNSSLWSQGTNMLAAGVYGIFRMPKRTATKAKLDDFSFQIRLFGYKALTKFPT